MSADIVNLLLGSVCVYLRIHYIFHNPEKAPHHSY